MTDENDRYIATPTTSKEHSDWLTRRESKTPYSKIKMVTSTTSTKKRKCSNTQDLTRHEPNSAPVSIHPIGTEPCALIQGV